LETFLEFCKSLFAPATAPTGMIEIIAESVWVGIMNLFSIFVRLVLELHLLALSTCALYGDG